MLEILKKLIRGETLSPEEASLAMTEIMTGQAGDARTAAFLTALSVKGESGREIEAFARAMRKAALPWPSEGPADLCDTCGTGGDSMGTLNISTLAALVLASMGIQVAKHGNRAVSGSTGSADLLEALAIKIEMTPDESLHCLKKAGICFLFAPAWHPAMKHAGPVRRALGFRTVFNLLGPLTNPAPVAYQVIGVFDKRFLDPVAGALSGLDRKGAMVVHSDDGLDEVSISASTQFIRIGGAHAGKGTFGPEEFGFSRSPISALQVKDRAESVDRARALLGGKGTDPENHTVAMNAALVYAMTKGTNDYKTAARDCLDVLRSGGAGKVVEKWAQFANGADTSVGT